ncbi:uncharacterized protein LOC125227549 [Leguminivora glycinivorella]|uniref:uncharacterized protein LOC125227549 n=1 Tax=Leguminivora glycinivorella TaxID=1035111 RepID=UPI00200E8C08|nr:uncharacterized protein LOC125227549 [Leguminivora glycinivorella]
MSPLARSLLALGALLAAADANVWELESLRPNCAGFRISARRYDGKPMEDIIYELRALKTGSGGFHDIPNYCAKYGVDIEYQSVVVCNEYEGRTSAPRKPPKVRPLSEDTMSPVYASCKGVRECGPLIFRVTQRCLP